LKVYFGTEDGLYVLNQSNGQISVISREENLGFIYAIKKFNHKIFIATANGLFQLKENNTAQPILTSSEVRNFTFIDNKLITSEVGSGVIEYISKDEDYVENRVFEEKSTIVDIVIENEKIILSTHGNGVFILNTDLSIYKHYIACEEELCLPSNFSASIEENKNSILISNRAGLVEINKASFEITNVNKFAEKIKNKFITDAARFSRITTNHFWVGFFPGGLLKYQRRISGISVFENDSPSTDGTDDGVFAIEKFNEALYVGTHSGLSTIDQATRTFKPLKQNHVLSKGAKRITTICNFDNSELILSTAQGPFSFSGDSFEQIQTKLESTRANSVSCDKKLYYLSQKNLITKYIMKKKVAEYEIDGVSDIPKILIVDDRIYVGSADGLFIFKIIRSTKLNLLNSYLPDKMILELFNSGDKIFVLTTHDIFVIEDNKLKKSKFKIPEELKRLRIYGAELISNTFWLATNNGIVLLSADSEYKHYLSSHGIGDVEFNFQATYYDEDANTFYAGGLNNVTAIDIDAYTSIEWPNPNVLSKVIVYDNQGALKQNIYGRPSNLVVDEGDSIVFELGHLDSLARSSANFFYTVNKRFSDSKVFLSPKERSISFVNITNDNFDLTISNSDKTISVFVTPYIWKRWWAYVFYGFILLGLLIWWRLNRERLRQIRQEEVITRRELNAKRNQLASLSHELRTPLNSIIGTLEGAKTLGADAKHINSSAYLLRSLIDNMLNNISMDVNNELAIIKSQFSTSELINECLEIMHPYLAHADIEVDYNFEPGFPAYIETDRTKLQQVILNLLKNAIKHGKTTSKIQINCHSSEFLLNIEVRDDGCGVLESKQDLLFDAFSRGDEHTSGFGLGLYISRVICTELGGNLWLDSSYLAGASFNIELPASIGCNKTSKPKEETAETHTPTKSLLIFEDDPLNIHALKLLVAKAGIKKFIVVSDLESYREEVAKGVEVIILDLNLGINQTGIDLARELKAGDYNGDVYMLSAETAPEVKAEALKYVQDYLTKPISISDLQRVTSRD
ncbi:MAG: hybrid sensor histidine kinase/response regulator, partial [Enterobacterales bacterium]|nr:hybrid sensor histidine kinase/response regulator [Enterobacterales bacterium]